MKYNNLKNNNLKLYNNYMRIDQDRKNKYNYEIAPLITNFSFIEFIDEGIRYGSNDYGAFLVITNNQYVVGYNSSFGKGTHMASFARTWADMNNYGEIRTDMEASGLSFLCEENCLTARIIYEKYDNSYCGYIHFMIPKDGITFEQFEIFEQFYEDYNKEISLVVNRYGINNFQVSFNQIDENGKTVNIIDKTLDGLYNYLKTRINSSKKIEMNAGEIIIGNKKISKSK